MRATCLTILHDLAKQDRNVVSLLADNGMIVYDAFRRDFPDRYFNFGIAEENMVAAAAGMASEGKIPFVYTIGAFLAYRAYEFLRDDVCIQNLNVKIIGIGAGLDYSTLGPTHHTTEDIGMLRSLPNLTVFSPATKREAGYAMKEAYNRKGPVYIRLSNRSADCLPVADDSFYVGKPSLFRSGEDGVIFTTGSILQGVMNAAALLAKDGISMTVYSVHTLKPLDAEYVADIVRNHDFFVTVEEHNVVGGLYGAIAEMMTLNRVTKPGIRIGLPDCFADGYGSLDDIRKANCLDTQSMYEKIKEVACSWTRE